MREKLKSFIADDALFLALLLVLVGVVSFGLGRQSVAGEAAIGPGAKRPAGVIFTAAPTSTQNLYISTDSETTQVIASRSGTKYHLPDCPGAQQIKEENKLYFESVTAAQAAGYSPAANCPGLQ